ncbi:MAG: molybdopterin-dependent oxidoreductase [bacterium]
MPLEALRYDITHVDPSSYRLVVNGLVETASSLDPADIRGRPQVSTVVTFECAGNGRGRLLARPVSQR